MAFLGPSLRRKRVVDRPAVRVAAAVAASLALNAALVFTAARLGAFELAKPVAPERVVLAPLSSDRWQANRAIAGAPRPPAPPPAPVAQVPPAAPKAAPPQPPPPPAAPRPKALPLPEERVAKGQIVDVAPSNDSRAPDKTRFLSDRDNRVEKESRSRWAGAKLWEKRAAAPSEAGEQPEGQGGKAAEELAAKEGASGTDGREGPKAAMPEVPSSPPAPSPERLARLERPADPGLPGPAVQRPAEPPLPQAQAQAGQAAGLGTPGAPGERRDAQKKAGDPRLLPSAASLARIAGGPSNDYIDDPSIAEGDGTALNTRAFKFATFFNRFKADVSAHWQPAIVYGERDPNGTMFGDRRERATGLHLVIDRTGAVQEIQVVEASGLDFLDREAVRAVRAASPFYNVPEGLLDARGQVVFSFSMVLVMNRAIPVRPVYQGH